jgi:hypothetical protein
MASAQSSFAPAESNPGIRREILRLKFTQTDLARYCVKARLRSALLQRYKVTQNTAQSEKTSEHQVKRHVSGPGFDLRYPGLARMNQLGQFLLSQLELLALFANSAADCEPKFNHRSFFGAEFEKVLGILENVASGLKSISLLFFHVKARLGGFRGDPQNRVIPFQSPLTRVDVL